MRVCIQRRVVWGGSVYGFWYDVTPPFIMDDMNLMESITRIARIENDGTLLEHRVVSVE